MTEFLSFSPLFLSNLPHLPLLIHLFSSSLLSLGDHAQIGSRGETNPSRVTCNHLLKEILTMTRRRSDSSGTAAVMAGKWLLVAKDNQPDETSCSFEESRCIVDRQPPTSSTSLSLSSVLRPVSRVERFLLDAQMLAAGRQAAAVSAAGDNPSHPYIIVIHAVLRPPIPTRALLPSYYYYV